MKSLRVLFILIMQLFISIVSNGQEFAKRIDSSFNGCFSFGTQINNSYYFFGSTFENSKTNLYCFKTDKLGNIEIKKNVLQLNSTGFICIKDSYNNLIVSNGNTLIKLNPDLELQWVKSYPIFIQINYLKATNADKYLFLSKNSVYQTDTSGNILADTIPINSRLYSMAGVNDTIYLLQSNQNNPTVNTKIVLSKYKSNGSLISQKTTEQYTGYIPILFEVFNDINKILVFTDIQKYKRTTLAVIGYDKDFNLKYSKSATFTNLWVNMCRYDNSSFMISGDYDGNASPDFRLVQMDNNLEVKCDYRNDFGFNTSMFLSNDGDFLSLYCSAFVKKIKCEKLTGISSESVENINFHPNPIVERSKIEFDFSELVTFELYDSQGKIIVNTTYSNISEIILSKTDVPISGLYLFRLKADGKYYSGKLVVE